MRMDLFDYDLPPSRIAQRPVEPRGASRLLILDRRAGAWQDARFTDLARALEPGDLLVVNDTRVFAARLHARTEEEGRIEFLLTHPAEAEDPELAASHEWWALARPARRARPGRRFGVLGREGHTVPGELEVLEVGEAGARRIRLDFGGDFWRWIDAVGHVPLPPYIERPDDDADRDRYQTIYACRRGAVAAPTAGLHFTPDLLDRLEARGVGRADVTLHVGPGTFRPVAAEDAEAHTMEAEWYRVPAETARAVAATRRAGGRVVAVGTTTVRALEMAVRMWEGGAVGAGTAGETFGWADLTIRPGYRFHAVDAMVTNFHLPRSSLLLLVSAFAGRELVLASYRHAVQAGYRFYSYGDAMLIV